MVHWREPRIAYPLRQRPSRMRPARIGANPLGGRPPRLRPDIAAAQRDGHAGIELRQSVEDHATKQSGIQARRPRRSAQQLPAALGRPAPGPLPEKALGRLSRRLPESGFRIFLLHFCNATVLEKRIGCNPGFAPRPRTWSPSKISPPPGGFVRPLKPIELMPREVYLRTMIGAIEAVRPARRGILPTFSAWFLSRFLTEVPIGDLAAVHEHGIGACSQTIDQFGQEIDAVGDT